ncbi:hypothetical protein N7510_007132 [Penicillium lagena]|uniref:uncharacterized protein n=1 Tax=Penicillium lagena TaxID=94218 RepID=UPI00253FB615|nr:uncharacterized protein N7510_007132 [Penicillium lagena]KAJ5610413.1 hypothetical protein N7510_007132 [Penicillium lagena]
MRRFPPLGPFWLAEFRNEARQARHVEGLRFHSSRPNPIHLHRSQTATLSTKRPSSKPEPLTKPEPKRAWKPVLGLFSWYSNTQKHRPYLTQLFITAFIYCLGDFSAQRIGNDTFDAHRSLRSIIIGAVVSIPSYEWFLFLGRRFNYSSSFVSIGAKVAVNQLFYTPLFNVYFFAFHALLSGEGLTGAVERVKATVPTSIPRSFLYWPLVTTFNFTYVSPESRAIATSLFAVFWQSYLSWLNNMAEKDQRRASGIISALVNP